jgi:acetyl esterase/lipase
MVASPNARHGRRLARSLAVLAVVGMGAAVAPPAYAAPAVAAQAEPPTPAGERFLDDVFDEVDVTHGVPYREAVNVAGELQTLHLEIYEPSGDTAERRPVVLMMHGGFFVLGNHTDDQWGAGPTYAEAFARKGFVAVSMQYRLRPEMGFYPNVELAEMEAANLDAYDDSVAAVQWLVDHADDLRLDPEAIVANGPSAGGAMAWNLAWMQGSRLRPEPSGVAAAVSVAGAPFEATADTGEPLAAASPGDRPVIAFHGTADVTVAFDLAEAPCSRAAAAGVRCDLVPLEGIGHPAIDPRFFELVPDIERRTVEFIAEVVLAPLGHLDQPRPDQPPPEPPPAGPGPEPTPPVREQAAPAVADPLPPGRAQVRPAVAVVAEPNYTG